VIYLSFAYLLIKDWIINERVKSKLESEKLSMELAFLKAQVNPHFLFNTLNNLYALSLEEKAQRTSDAITKMGALMRYNLHDAQAERILLTKELDYLDQYIELQKLRIVKQSQISFYTNVQPGNCTAKVAPMILLPFIENAFKYGVSTVGETRIQAEAVLVQDTFKLTVKNTLHKNPERVESGIGLKNVRNRLELIYGGKYALKQTKDDEEYSIELELDLTE
jgi:two-component system, LytTR family, sensor kinase